MLARHAVIENAKLQNKRSFNNNVCYFLLLSYQTFKWVVNWACVLFKLTLSVF